MSVISSNGIVEQYQQMRSYNENPPEDADTAFAGLNAACLFPKVSFMVTIELKLVVYDQRWSLNSQ